MKVLLVRPNSVLRATTLPLGMGYVAEAARRAGHSAALLDARLDRLGPVETVRRIREASPDVVGISGIHFEKQGAIDLARALREAGVKVPLVLGGALVSTSGEELVRAGLVDGAIAGEGEQSFVSYLEALSGRGSFESVPGLIRRTDGDDVSVNPPGPFLADADLDDLQPAWDLIGLPRYFRLFGRSTLNMLRRSSRSASVFTSRGCPFGCIYCHNLFGRKFRARSPQAVLAELRMLKDTYGVREIEIVDDAFNVNLDRAKEIARRIISEKLGLHFSFSNGLRADRMDRELIDLLRRAGVYRINYAIETASPRLQKLIHKNLDLDRTREIIAETADRGIFTLGYFMLGFPTETEDELHETMDYAIASRLHAAAFFYVTPFPGTELSRSFPVEDQLKPRLDGMDYTALSVNLSAVPDEVLRGMAKQAYRKFHFAPDRIRRTFKVAPKNFRTLLGVAVTAVLSLRDFGNF